MPEARDGPLPEALVSRHYFRDGKLKIFSHRQVLVLRGGPECAAWELRKDVWRGVRPVTDVFSTCEALARPDYVAARTERFLRRLGTERSSLLAPERADELARLLTRLQAGWTTAHRAASDFLATFPPAAVAIATRLWVHQWHVMQLMARSEAALDLASTNVALALGLATGDVFRAGLQRPLRAARALLRKPRAEIAGWLGFPGTASTVKLLGKIPDEDVSLARLFWLRTTLAEPEPPPALRHLPALPGPVLRILCDARLRQWATFSLLEEVALEPAPDPKRLDTGWELLALVEESGQLGDARVIRVRSIAELHELRAQRRGELRRARRAAPARLVFPPPPVPACDAIVPLTTPHAVAAEAEEMRHCADGYSPRIAAGACYLYRVMAPERATVSVVRTDRGWQLGELKGPRNRPVTAETLAFVRQWVGGEGEGEVEPEDEFELWEPEGAEA